MKGTRKCERVILEMGAVALSQFRGPNYLGAWKRPLHRQLINIIELKSDIGKNASASVANWTFCPQLALYFLSNFIASHVWRNPFYSLPPAGCEIL